MTKRKNPKLIYNYTIEKDEKDKSNHVPKTMAKILEEIRNNTGKWPRMAGGLLFAIEEEEIQYFDRHAAFFGWLQSTCGHVYWQNSGPGFICYKKISKSRRGQTERKAKMATITTDPNSNRRLQFKAPDGKRRTIRLGKVTKKIADQVRYHVEEILSARSANVPLSAATTAWIKTLSDAMRDRLAACGLVQRQERVKLGEFMDRYIKGRPSLKPNTVRNLEGSSSLLKEFYGLNRQVHTIKKSDADAFREFLVSKKYSPATIGRVIKRARQFLKAAIRLGLVDSDPFADVNAPQQVNDTRRQYVPEEVVYKAIEAAPNAEWRLIIALSRFGGLRIPSELVTLKWQDIDWEHNRIRVPQPKLEHLGGSCRVIPLFPRLRPYLEEQFELAEPGDEYVISRNRTATSNLRTQLQRILKRAMIEPWPRLFHNMRASFQTDICEEFPAHVSAQWCGNSLATAEKHYLSTRGSFSSSGRRSRNRPRKSDAKSDAR